MKTPILQARNVFRIAQLKLMLLAADESGMSTVEYATVVLYTRVLVCALRSLERCNSLQQQISTRLVVVVHSEPIQGLCLGYQVEIITVEDAAPPLVLGE